MRIEITLSFLVSRFVSAAKTCPESTNRECERPNIWNEDACMCFAGGPCYNECDEDGSNRSINSPIPIDCASVSLSASTMNSSQMKRSVSAFSIRNAVRSMNMSVLTSKITTTTTHASASMMDTAIVHGPKTAHQAKTGFLQAGASANHRKRSIVSMKFLQVVFSPSPLQVVVVMFQVVV